MNINSSALQLASGPTRRLEISDLYWLTAGQVSDYTKVAARLDSLAEAQWLLVDRKLQRRLVPSGLVSRDGNPLLVLPITTGGPIIHIRQPQGLETCRHLLRQHVPLSFSPPAASPQLTCSSSTS